MIDSGKELPIASKNLTSVVETDLGPVEQTMRFRKSTNIRSRKVISFQRNDIDTSRPSGLAVEQHVGWDVMNDATHSRHERVRADRCEMVDGTCTGDRRMVIDMHVASEQHTIRHDDTITDTAIVRNV